MAGGWQAPVGALLLLVLLVTNVTAAGLSPSTTPTPSTSTSAPPPASLLATPPPPLPSAPAISATSSRPSSAMLSASADLDHPSGSSPAPPAVPARLFGCDPMKVANALFTHCRGAPGPEAILNERCCVTVVSTVARPSCFCLVQKESAFVMSAVHNKSSMGNLLQRCGAPADLIRIVDDPCGDTAHTMDDRSCAVSMKASTSCLSWKITAIVALTVVCVLVLVAPALYLWLWRQAPARRARM